jgi:hypothetical protein
MALIMRSKRVNAWFRQVTERARAEHHGNAFLQQDSQYTTARYGHCGRRCANAALDHKPSDWRGVILRIHGPYVVDPCDFLLPACLARVVLGVVCRYRKPWTALGRSLWHRTNDLG